MGDVDFQKFMKLNSTAYCTLSKLKLPKKKQNKKKPTAKEKNKKTNSNPHRGVEKKCHAYNSNLL